MPRYVTGICRNCKEYFDGCVNHGLFPKFCSPECRYEYSRKPKQIKKRFWSYVTVGEPDECWLWVGIIHPRGYGQFHYTRTSGKRKYIRAHRFAYMITRGKISKNLFVCHTCDVPPCCNPDHLFLGTPLDNMLDKVSKNRQARQKGESHGNAKLTESDVRDILRLKSEGYTQRVIADTYHITFQNVSMICTGENWKHLVH